MVLNISKPFSSLMPQNVPNIKEAYIYICRKLLKKLGLPKLFKN